MSEYRQFLEVLRLLGVKHEVHHAPATSPGMEETLRAALRQGGFNLTPLALSGVIVGDTWFIFSDSAPHWIADNLAVGPAGCYLFSLNPKDPLKGSHRVVYRQDGHLLDNVIGFKAVTVTHGSAPYDPNAR